MLIPIAAAYPCVAVPLCFVVEMPITVIGLLSGVAAALPLVTTAASIGELELAYPAAADGVPN